MEDGADAEQITTPPPRDGGVTNSTDAYSESIHRSPAIRGAYPVQFTMSGAAQTTLPDGSSRNLSGTSNPHPSQCSRRARAVRGTSFVTPKHSIAADVHCRFIFGLPPRFPFFRAASRFASLVEAPPAAPVHTGQRSGTWWILQRGMLGTFLGIGESLTTAAAWTHAAMRYADAAKPFSADRAFHFTVPQSRIRRSGSDSPSAR